MALLQSKWLRMFAWILLMLTSFFFVITGTFFDSKLLWLSLFVICFFNAYLEYTVSALFISPGKRKKSIDSKKWKSHYFLHDSITTHMQINQKSEPAPLVVFIHGWRGSSASVFERAEWFVQNGWHAVIFELPGHGMSTSLYRWNAITASRHIQRHLQNLDGILDSEKVTDFFFYGHSMGGYISTRLSSKKVNIPNGMSLTGVILESPLLLYSNILNEIVGHLKIPTILRPLHLRRVFRDVTSMHPDIQIDDGLKQFDVPSWGVPLAPTLVLQAMNDTRLGRGHYDAAVKEFPKSIPFEHHLIESLSHTGARTNEEREEILLNWLNEFDSLQF